MPCRDTGPHPETSNLDNLFKKFEEVRDRLDERTAQLCLVMDFLETHDYSVYDLIPQNIRDWHEEHKEFDKKRRSTMSGPKE